MSARRYCGRRVNDVLVTSNIPQDRRTADAEASAAHPRHDLATGYEALEIKKPWKSRSFGNQEALKLRSFGNFHQQPFGLGILDAVHKAAALMHVTHGLGQGDAGLNEHHDAHREIALDPQIDRQKVHADGDQERRGAERSIGEGDPGVAVMLDILIHGAILQMRSCDEISVSDGHFAKPSRNLIRPAFLRPRQLMSYE